MNKCLIRIEIGEEPIVSAEIPLKGGKQGVVIRKCQSDLLWVEKAAVCRGLAHVASFLEFEGWDPGHE